MMHDSTISDIHDVLLRILLSAVFELSLFVKDRPTSCVSFDFSMIRDINTFLRDLWTTLSDSPSPTRFSSVQCCPCREDFNFVEDCSHLLLDPSIRSASQTSVTSLCCQALARSCCLLVFNFYVIPLIESDDHPSSETVREFEESLLQLAYISLSIVSFDDPCHPEISENISTFILRSLDTFSSICHFGLHVLPCMIDKNLFRFWSFS